MLSRAGGLVRIPLKSECDGSELLYKQVELFLEFHRELAGLVRIPYSASRIPLGVSRGCQKSFGSSQEWSKFL